MTIICTSMPFQRMFGFISLLPDSCKGRDEENENNKRMLWSIYAISGYDGLQIFTTYASLSHSDWPDSSFNEMVPRSCNDRTSSVGL